MAYGTNCIETCAPDCNVPLDKIGMYANDLDAVASYIQAFLDRCRGGGDTAKLGGPTPVPSGHLGELERLGNALHRVDCLARELQTIG